jgi:hypothetical protein
MHNPLGISQSGDGEDEMGRAGTESSEIPPTKPE